MWPRRCFILAVLLCTGLFETVAQQLPFVHYTPRNGLVNNRAHFIFQDRKGRLFISTYGGLSIYDGTRFINYTTDDGLVTSLINDIVDMGDDSLWILPNGHMIHCLVHGQLKNINTSNHFYPVVNQLIKGNDGFYYAVAEEGLFRYEKNHFVRMPVFDASGQAAVKYLNRAVSWKHYLFLLTDSQLDRFPGPGKLFVYDLISKQTFSCPNRSPFYFMTTTPKGEIWLASSTGIKKINTDELENHEVVISSIPNFEQPPNNLVSHYIYFDNQKNAWFSTDQGIYKINTACQNKLFSQKNGLSAGITSSIFQDREGTMWFANEQTGICKLANEYVELFEAPAPHFRAGIIYSNPLSDSTWFFDAENEKLLLLNKDKQTIFSCLSPIASPIANIIMGAHPLLIAMHHIYRLQFLTGNRFRANLIFTDTLTSLGSSVQDQHGNLVLVSYKLTTILSGKIAQRPFTCFADQPVIDQYDNLWISTRNNKLFKGKIVITDTGYALTALMQIDNSAMPQIDPRSLTVDRSGRVWIGTREHGLFCLTIDQGRVKTWKQFTVADGLSSNFITSLFCDDDNSLWACTSASLDKLNYTQGQLSVENITGGFDNYQFVLNIQQAAHGIHWASSRSGLLKITDHNFPEKKTVSPGIIFSKIVSGDEVINPDQPIRLTYQKNSIHFYMASPSFLNETQTRFQYRLDGGSNKKWSNPATGSEINFDNLLPGKYTFHAKALFLGRYPEQETSIGFVVMPPWWQMWWFKLLTVLAVSAFVVAGTRFYTRWKLEKQRIYLKNQKAIEEERTRIAMEMHDDLGAGLTRIKFISEDISEKTNDDRVMPDIEKLKASSYDLVEKMGEIIWAMNEKNNTLEDLIFYLRGYAVDYCQENGLECDFVLPHIIPDKQVSGKVRRNIFLILKESLHNIVKHAGAERAIIQIRIDRNLVLQIRDDGSGFKNTYRTGNGLLNMRSRAKAMDGTLTILQEGQTAIHLEIPV